jgi:PEP-CTERM motif
LKHLGIARFLALFLLFVPALRADTVTVSNGGSLDVTYNGFQTIGDPSLTGLSATAHFSDFQFQYIAGSNITQLTFNIALSNTSTSPITASRVAIMGFDTTPTILSAPPSPYQNSVTGVYDEVMVSGNFPYGIGTVEFCFSGVNCAGSGSAGVTQGNTGNIAATLYFGGNVSSLTFDNLYIKWQSVDCPTCSPAVQGGSFGGTGTAAPVPEPATLSLLGSGLVGAWYRRRKRGTAA